MDLGPRQLSDLELLLNGALSPLVGYMGADEHRRVCAEMRLADGTLWPIPITLDVTHIGAGKDPWGGMRRGFEGTTSLTLQDFDIDYNLGPKSKEVEITLSVEGIRQ